jgi:hypothetical protein
MIVIGFGHRARQGKNTAAQAALEACPLETQVRQYAFSDALKSEVRLACARSGGQWNLINAWKDAGIMPDWVQYEDPKPRSLLQWWGTEYRRAKDPQYWVKKLARTLEQHDPEVALITDVRFPNEIAFVKSLGGFVVKCTRTTAPDFEVNEHPSEAELDGFHGWDFYINADTVADCQYQAREILKQCLKANSSIPTLKPGPQ